MLTAKQMLNKEYDEATRQRLIKAARLLQTGTPGKGIQKEEIAEVVGLSGEREARAYVSPLKIFFTVDNGIPDFSAISCRVRLCLSLSLLRSSFSDFIISPLCNLFVENCRNLF